jgi:hypothetical protein
MIQDSLSVASSRAKQLLTNECSTVSWKREYIIYIEAED